MNIKAHIKDINAVSVTLLLPLYFRAMETIRPDAIVTDDYAVDIIDHIDYDFSKIAGYNLIRIATLMRVKEFDSLVTDFLEKNPDSVIVNIGCGLDTRFNRTDNGIVKWYELDFPEVIALRKQFFHESIRCRFIESSVLDFSWADAIKFGSTSLRLEPTIPILFLAEGVFMYLKEADIRKLIQGLKDRFPGSVLAFDAVSSFQALLSYFHPAIMATGARFQWGLRNSRDVEKWVPGIRLINERFYFDQRIHRIGWYNLLRLFPHIANGFSIISYQL